MYRINEGTIDLPESWKDQSINIVASSGSGSVPGLTFTITRDDVPWGMTFPDFVDGEIEKAADALTEFKVLSKAPVKVGGRDAVQIECTWKAKQGPMHQIITTVHAPTHAMVITASMPGRMTESQKIEVRNITASMRFDPASV